MAKNRIPRLNSLLREVLSEVIRQEVHNPQVHPFFTVTSVEITKDLQHAKVYISVIGTELEKENTVRALQSAAGYIAILSSKKVVMRYFPALNFKLDSSVDHQMRVDTLLNNIKQEQLSRKEPNDSENTC